VGTILKKPISCIVEQLMYQTSDDATKPANMATETSNWWTSDGSENGTKDVTEVFTVFKHFETPSVFTVQLSCF
jgi:hypothetical protein